jgi:hypothetical protein
MKNIYVATGHRLLIPSTIYRHSELPTTRRCDNLSEEKERRDGDKTHSAALGSIHLSM